MAGAITEEWLVTPMTDEPAVSSHTPLLSSSSSGPCAPRTVTFHSNLVTKTTEPKPIEPDTQSRGQHRRGYHLSIPPAPQSPSANDKGSVGESSGPMVAALNNRLRKRNSTGEAAGSLALAAQHAGSGNGTLCSAAGPGAHQPKLGPQRSSKNAQKLKLLPTPESSDRDGTDSNAPHGEDDDGDDELRDVYAQYSRIKDPTARRDARRLGKADRDRLPRVTAYCTANKYQMDGLMRFLKGRGRMRRANPKLIDECIYTPYQYRVELEASTQPSRHKNKLTRSVAAGVTTGVTSSGLSAGLEGDLLHLDDDSASDDHGHALHLGESAVTTAQNFDTEVHTPELFLFDYGVVVIWGMQPAEEQRFLKEIAKFELEKLAPDDVETEYFNFYYTQEYQARIYNDFITLRDKKSYMVKLAISHALAQSVKTSLFEELIASTIESCKDIPTQIALTGKIALSRTQINMQIGDLFILRINIHLNGSVLDTPELFWVEPKLEPIYQAVRDYLEIEQRVKLVTDRLEVISDFLSILREQLSSGHEEKLEWIVIILIAVEILVGIANIVVDYTAGAH